MADRSIEERGRGRHAETPSDLPGAGWRDILLRTRQEMTADHVTMVAASVAFYALLALFPAIAATVSIWGLLFDPSQVEAQIAQVSGLLPQEAASIVSDQARRVAGNAGTGASLAAIFGILFALYSSSKGVKALIEGLNIVYDEEETRGFVRLNLVALALTLGLILMVLASLALIAVVPALAGQFGLGETARTLVIWLRWPLLAVVAIAGLAILYRFAPCRADPRWRWVSWGAAAATLVWLAGSVAFSIYVRNFGSYNETYGTLGAVIVLLLWFWLSALIVLLGAELNAEMEHQTARDTTAGHPRARGQRGAHVADTLGRRP